MLQAVLFDFDGTLIDTNDLILLSLRETAKKFLEKDLDLNQINEILGKPLKEQMKCLSSTQYHEMVFYYKEFYSNHKNQMIKEFPGILEMLKHVKSTGFKTAIVSAKGRNGILHGLQFFGLEPYIDVVISAYDVENHKPHPEPALKALQMLDVAPGSALLVGDSPYDILCGKNAGTKTALVAWTIFPKEAILALDPDFVIKNPKDLLSILSNQS